MDPILEIQIISVRSIISIKVHSSIQDQDIQEVSKDSPHTQTDHLQDSTIGEISIIREIDSQERGIIIEISITAGTTTTRSKDEISHPTEKTITNKKETSTIQLETKLIEDLLIPNPKQTEETSLIITEKYLSKPTKTKETLMKTETREQIISSKTSMRKNMIKFQLKTKND